MQIKAPNGEITDLENMQLFSLVQHAGECRLPEEITKKMQFEFRNLGSEKVHLEKSYELQEKVKYLTDSCADAKSHAVCINLSYLPLVFSFVCCPDKFDFEVVDVVSQHIVRLSGLGLVVTLKDDVVIVKEPGYHLEGDVIVMSLSVNI